MSEEERILQMVADGELTAEEANERLATLEEAEPAPSLITEARQDLPVSHPWQAPFGAGLALTFLTAAGLAKLYRSRRTNPLLLVGGWLTFALAALVALVGLWSRNAPWLHIRVEEADGDRVNLHFPLPLGLAGWVFSLARGYVDEETAGHLDTASAFLDSMGQDKPSEPFMIEVDEGDGGDRVLLYIG